MHEKGTNSMPVIEYTLRLYIALSLCITMNVCVCVSQMQDKLYPAKQ